MIKHYRSDIDGLRALSIILVIIFHAFPHSLHGGFIGVDVFFVISGYLITSILLENMDQNKFSFIDFYARRIKRLYPCLLVVLVATLAYGWFVLFPLEFKQLSKHALASSLYINNFILYKESGYFDAASNLKPLLHLWSLSIEEQFYLIWPFMLYFLKKKKIPVGYILLICLITSFLFNIYYIYRKHSFAFYMPVTRFWELLVGAGLAYIKTYKNQFINEKRDFISKKLNLSSLFINHILSAIGILMIIGCALTIDESKLFPGWWALLPTLGAFLIIFAGSSAWINAKILSNKLMVGIGKISYPLYLWHWPLLSFPRIIKGDTLEVPLTVGLLTLCVLLSYLTYKFFETPLRKKSNFTAIPLLSGMVPIVIIGIAVKSNLFSSWINSDVPTAKVVNAINEWDYPKGLTFKKIRDRDFYEIGSHPKKVLFFGDSNMEQYAPRIKKLILEDPSVKRSAVFLTSGGCPPIPNIYEDKHPQLKGFAEDAIDYAKDSKVDTIVIGAQWIGYFNTNSTYYYQKDNINSAISHNSMGIKQALQDFTSMLKEWTDKGKKVYLVLNMPIDYNCSPQAMIERNFFSAPLFQTTSVKTEDWLNTSQLVSRALKEAAAQANVTIIDPTLSLCDAQKCQVLTSTGEPLYKDSCHLRPTYVENHVQYLDEVLF